MKEVLKLALEALERVTIVDYYCDILSPSLADAVTDAITAIKEALAQPEQEPVAKYTGETYRCPIVNLYQNIPVGTLLYTTPQKEQRSCDKRPWGKPWVSLTDEDISSVLSNLQVMYNRPPTTDSRAVFARAIEAKLKAVNGFLKEKNAP